MLALCLISTGQKDSLNRLNIEGEKTGYWIQYLDNSLNPIDSTNSHFYAYELYDNGKRVFKFYKKKYSKKSN